MEYTVIRVEEACQARCSVHHFICREAGSELRLGSLPCSGKERLCYMLKRGKKTVAVAMVVPYDRIWVMEGHTYPKPLAYLWGLVVRHDERGKGIGRILFEEVLRQHPEIWLLATASSNGFWHKVQGIDLIGHAYGLEAFATHNVAQNLIRK